MINLLLGAFFLLLAMVMANLLAAGLGTWAIGAGERWGAMSPVTPRSSHAQPTSRLGGIGLAAGLFIPSILFVAAIRLLPSSEFSWGGNLDLLGWLLLGAVIMFAVGLADDLWGLPAPFKLAGQMMATIPVIAAPLQFLHLSFPGIPGVAPDTVSAFAAALWVLFFVNAFNFMDGMDGFAVRFGLYFCQWLMTIFFIKIAVYPALFGSGVFYDLLAIRVEFLILPIAAAACAGFYRINRSPARVFMGDGGSLTLGYFLAIQAMLADGAYYTSHAQMPGPATHLPASVVWILLLPFIFDVVLTLVRRARNGENLMAAHRGHLYQRLMIRGLSHREVLRLNLRYFRLCGLIALIYALVPAPHWVRALLWMAALGVMIHYWREVLARESEKS